jgi:hypothetical protein
LAGNGASINIALEPIGNEGMASVHVMHLPLLEKASSQEDVPMIKEALANAKQRCVP